MASSLSVQMLDAYQRNSSWAIQVLKQYKDRSAFNDPERFELLLRNRFLDGVHSAFAEFIVKSLRQHLGSQQAVAAALGLKDRTSISQMIRSRTMDGVRITAALHLYGDHITLPTREVAALYGFAEATSYIKAVIYEDDSIEGSLPPQDFSLLIGILASDDWDDALLDPDLSVARKEALKIVSERDIGVGYSVRYANRRPEQIVLMLRELQVSWADCGTVALCSIPDCIPLEGQDAEVTL